MTARPPWDTPNSRVLQAPSGNRRPLSVAQRPLPPIQTGLPKLHLSVSRLRQRCPEADAPVRFTFV